jgi:hypothetical protein
VTAALTEQRDDLAEPAVRDALLRLTSLDHHVYEYALRRYAGVTDQAQPGGFAPGTGRPGALPLDPVTRKPASHDGP